MPPTPRSRDFFNIFVKFFSIFRVFVNAVRVQNFFGTSGSSRSVCCQSFSSVRRLEATKTPKNRNEKKCKLWTGVYPPRIAPFGFKLGQNAFQTIPDISFVDSQNFFRGEFVCHKMWLFVPKNHLPLFWELRQTSRDRWDSDSDSNESWDVCFNSRRNTNIISRVK